jgi:hypothetical protein
MTLNSIQLDYLEAYERYLGDEEKVEASLNTTWNEVAASFSKFDENDQVMHFNEVQHIFFERRLKKLNDKIKYLILQEVLFNQGYLYPICRMYNIHRQHVIEVLASIDPMEDKKAQSLIKDATGWDISSAPDLRDAAKKMGEFIRFKGEGVIGIVDELRWKRPDEFEASRNFKRESFIECFNDIWASESEFRVGKKIMFPNEVENTIGRSYFESSKFWSSCKKYTTKPPEWQYRKNVFVTESLFHISDIYYAEEALYRSCVKEDVTLDDFRLTNPYTRGATLALCAACLEFDVDPDLINHWLQEMEDENGVTIRPIYVRSGTNCEWNEDLAIKLQFMNESDRSKKDFTLLDELRLAKKLYRPERENEPLWAKWELEKMDGPRD